MNIERGTKPQTCDKNKLTNKQASRKRNKTKQVIKKQQTSTKMERGNQSQNSGNNTLKQKIGTNKQMCKK